MPDNLFKLYRRGLPSSTVAYVLRPHGEEKESMALKSTPTNWRGYILILLHLLEIERRKQPSLHVGRTILTTLNDSLSLWNVRIAVP
jgi:hypothetical protein